MLGQQQTRMEVLLYWREELFRFSISLGKQALLTSLERYLTQNDHDTAAQLLAKILDDSSFFSASLPFRSAGRCVRCVETRILQINDHRHLCR